jgi:hypothetical protein
VPLLYLLAEGKARKGRNAKVFLTKCKKNDTIFSFDLGVWCNGSTKVSKTFCEGSNPSTPAKNPIFGIFLFYAYEKGANQQPLNSTL